MAKLVKKSPVPLYLAAAVWAVWALFAPMYAWWHFVLAAVCSAAAWLLGRKLFPNRVQIVPDEQPPVREPEDPLLQERQRALSELRRLNDNIQDEKISAQISHMEEVTGKIRSSRKPANPSACQKTSLGRKYSPEQKIMVLR